VHNQCVALDFPTKSATPTGAVSDSVALPTLGTAGHAIYEVVNVCSDANQLDEMVRLLWRCYGEGNIGEGEATYLSSIIDR
jgi:hypothetical protein